MVAVVSTPLISVTSFQTAPVAVYNDQVVSGNTSAPAPELLIILIGYFKDVSLNYFLVSHSSQSCELLCTYLASSAILGKEHNTKHWRII